MAKLKGNDVLFEVNMGTTLASNWQAIGCITDNGLDSASDVITGDSKCGPDSIPGDVTWTANVEAFYDLAPVAGQVSGQTLLQVRQSGDYKDYRMRNVANTYYRGFNAYISAYGESAPYNDLVKYTAEFTVKGALITTSPTT